MKFAKGKKGKDGGGKGGDAVVKGEGVAIGGRGGNSGRTEFVDDEHGTGWRPVKKGSGAGGEIKITLPDDFFVETADTRKAELIKIRRQNKKLLIDAQNLYKIVVRYINPDAGGAGGDVSKTTLEHIDQHLILMQEYKETK